jgi:two-component system LytT family response regulator
MLKIILVDDEPLSRSIIREYLTDYPGLEIVAECGDGFEGVKAIAQFNPDLVFLDIQMPKINGFEMLELIDPLPQVIFTTAFDEYAMKAFEAHALDYLLKPFSKERFDKAMQKWMTQNKASAKNEVNDLLENPPRRNEDSQRIVVKNGNNIRIIPSNEIYYIEAFDDYVKIFTKDDFFLKKKTMSYYEQVLGANEFLRIHRSYIIRLEHLTRVEPFEKNSYIALLKNGARIPVSRTGYTRLKETLGF